MRGAIAYRFADQDRRAVILVQTFQAGGEVDVGAERRVVHPVGRADVADDGVARMQSAPRVVGGPSFPLEFGIQPFVGAHQCQRGGAGIENVIVVIGRRIPHRHEAVADELVDRSSMRHDFVRYRGEIARCVLHDLRRICPFGQLGEPRDVRKQESDVAPRATQLQRRASFDELLHQPLRYELREGLGDDPHRRDGAAKFIDLARELGDLGVWVRLQYVYPYPHVDDVIELMTEGKVLPYLDIPFQHANPEVLRRMKRPAAQDKTLARIKSWREACPDLTLRSTFIVGFPGETDSEFADLLDWLDEAQIDRAGAFKYEPVAGATANALESPVAEEIKLQRWNALMARQKKISAQRLKRKVGTRQQVIIDDVGPTVVKGRTKGDAPQIDGAVFLSSRRPLKVGEIVTAKIERSDDYDLHGTVAGF